ncbi:hypothetical protein PENSUB_5378 [Penicillium subrubescens]|uniref:Uncharacterized protein n=1 Tax=Penicillium subrubescens TaxID=1316194 RepID=A0A1Q5U9Y2_9EURO|nr:hypothetical protein PENSUB_5378 [Penicillium subrubescens]
MRHTPSQRLLSKLLREHDGRRRRRVLDVEEEEPRREQSERTTSGLEPSRDCRPGANDGVCNYLPLLVRKIFLPGVVTCTVTTKA